MGRPLTYSTALSTTGVSDYAVTSAPPYRGGSLDVTAPDQVTNLVVTDDTDGTLSLAWDAEADAHIYRVYRGTVSGSLSLYAVVGTNSFADNSVSLTTYYYQVSAVDLSGNEGTKSAEDSALVTDVVNPTVALTEPNGGETLTVGVPFDIEYSASDAGGIDYVQAHYQIDGGSWVLIDQDDENSGILPWTPDTAGVNVLLRVTAYDLAGNSASDESNATFTIASGSVSPLAPDEVMSATLYSWWKYDDDSPLTTGDVAAIYGDPITKASDESGNGRILSYVDQDAEPRLGPDGIWFKSANGNGLRNINLTPTHQSGCVFFGGKFTDLSGDDQTVLSLYNDSDSNAYISFGVNGATGQVFKQFESGATTKRIYTTFTLEEDTLYGILWMSSGSETRIWINGDEKAVLSETGPDIGTWFGDVPIPEGGMSMGERIASNQRVDLCSMVVQDAGIFSSEPSDGECAGLSLYLSTARDAIAGTTSIVVTSPNGGESLETGETWPITWTPVGVESATAYYSTTADTGPWTEIVLDEEGTITGDSMLWQIPTNLITTDLWVRVVGVDAFGGDDVEDVSNASCEVLDVIEPEIQLTSPNGGQVWVVGESRAITWIATDNDSVDSIDLYYTTDGAGGDRTEIATGLSNTGTYAWMIPNDASTDCYVVAVANDPSGNTREAISTAPFEISASEEDAGIISLGIISVGGTY